jgi:uncharacterized cupredoxin-like copper-binding protein
MRYAILLTLPLASLAASSVPAQAPAVVNVQLANFKFTPKDIVLKHGQSYVLHLTNVSDGGHDFVAEAFFDAANVAPADRRLIAEGGVEVPSGQAVEIHLTAPAAPGSFKLKCSHTFHKTFGMSGTIVVL